MKRPFLIKFSDQTVMIKPEELPQKKGLPLFTLKTMEQHLRQYHPEKVCRFKYNQMINELVFQEIDRHCRGIKPN